MSLAQVPTHPVPFLFLPPPSSISCMELLGCTALYDLVVGSMWLEAWGNIQLESKSANMESMVLESKQASSSWKCSLSPLQPGCAGENIRFEGPEAGDPLMGHSHNSASGSVPCCHRPVAPANMKEDLLYMNHKPWLNWAFGEWGSMCWLLQGPIKLVTAGAREDSQKCKVTMCYLEDRGKSCKPSQATSVLGVGFGMLSPVACLLLQSHQGCPARVHGAQDHLCPAPPAPQVWWAGLAQRYLSFPSPKGAAAEQEVLTGGWCASVLGGWRALAGLEASLLGGTGSGAMWDLGNGAPLYSQALMCQWHTTAPICLSGSIAEVKGWITLG